ncbi:integrase catalytic domain-containing protein [Trichonephila clavipes]|nr:integrase catalytic domain-containing protein [Trichonephila clavipes]
MKILPDGRYEFCLPFTSEAIVLFSNKDLTWKRHKKMCERAQRNGILGPNLNEQIPDILDRFRRYPIGLSADIEKAFLQLGITTKQRDFLNSFTLTRVRKLFTVTAEWFWCIVESLLVSCSACAITGKCASR